MRLRFLEQRERFVKEFGLSQKRADVSEQVVREIIIVGLGVDQKRSRCGKDSELALFDQLSRVRLRQRERFNDQFVEFRRSFLPIARSPQFSYRVDQGSIFQALSSGPIERLRTNTLGRHRREDFVVRSERQA